MKIPKTFIPKKSLEEKTKQLLEEPKKNKDTTKRNRPLHDELKAEFPNFTGYLYNLYSSLGIAKKIKDEKGTVIWKFYIINQKATSPLLVCKIEPYVEEWSKDVSEYGYHTKILIEGNWHFLKYRIGYHCFDNANSIISTKNLLRCDEEKDIPFP